jgi:flavin-dependent dehydrogenase
MSKKLVSFDGGKENVTATFDENTTARSDIPVGADGTHSAVRHHLYRAFSLVDTIQALDHIGYPGVLQEASDAHYVIGDKDLPYISGRSPTVFNFTSPNPSLLLTSYLFS